MQLKDKVDPLYKVTLENLKPRFRQVDVVCLLSLMMCHSNEVFKSISNKVVDDGRKGLLYCVLSKILILL